MNNLIWNTCAVFGIISMASFFILIAFFFAMIRTPGIKKEINPKGKTNGKNNTKIKSIKSNE